MGFQIMINLQRFIVHQPKTILDIVILK
ncbi:hypothetical protein MTR67_024725 [Solanum verrucosum]|uniref:Uncharacterized protein n=1 Tax=Solanum verrucosum TaxID=315347 RepID=A0AAF0QYX9_SOLVR|nr:hypothetical protein MTR67_024725 [Solanum verrucosum]